MMTDLIGVSRDDGPLTEAVGRLWRVPSPPLFAAVVGAVLPFVTLGARSTALALFAAVWCTLIAGLASHHPHSGRLDWLVLPVLRVSEYTFAVAVGLAHDVPGPLVFATVGALAFHHYDTVYRVRQHTPPPRWLRLAGLGWDGRMLVVGASAAAGVTVEAYAALAVALWVLFVTESATSWARTPRGQGRTAMDLERE